MRVQQRARDVRRIWSKAKAKGMRPLEYYFTEARTEFISRLADIVKFIIDAELGTATAHTIQKHLKEKYGKEYRLEDIDEAIELITSMYPDDYEKYRRSGHLGIRKTPNPKTPVPKEATELAEQLLTP